MNSICCKNNEEELNSLLWLSSKPRNPKSSIDLTELLEYKLPKYPHSRVEFSVLYWISEKLFLEDTCLIMRYGDRDTSIEYYLTLKKVIEWYKVVHCKSCCYVSRPFDLLRYLAIITRVDPIMTHNGLQFKRPIKNYFTSFIWRLYLEGSCCQKCFRIRNLQKKRNCYYNAIIIICCYRSVDIECKFLDIGIPKEIAKKNHLFYWFY